MRTSVFLCAGSLLMGCGRQPYTPHAEPTRVACGWSPEPLETTSWQHVPAISEACIYSIFDDFGADQLSLEAHDNGSVHALITGDESAIDTLAGTLIHAAWSLLALDLGDVDDLKPISGLHERLSEVAQDTGENTVGGATYDFVASAIQHTVAGNNPDLIARINLQSASLELHQPRAGVYAAAILVHESRHLDPKCEHQACPSDPTLACDDGWDGPYGWQQALLLQGVESAVYTDTQAELLNAAQELDTHILE